MELVLRSAEYMNKAIGRREKARPELWARCYPRHYEVSTTYPSPKLLGMELFDICWDWRKEDLPPERRSTIDLAYAAASELIKLRVPIFFVAPDLFKAVRLTVPPMDLEWTTFPLPFQSAAFALPRGSLSHRIHGNVGYIWYARLNKGHHGFVLPDHLNAGPTEDDYLLVFLSCLESPARPTFSYILKASSNANLDLRRLHDDGIEPIGLEMNELVEDNLTLMATATSLLFGVLFAMNTRESLWHRGKKVGQSKRSGREFWTPNIIGKDYALKGQQQGTQVGTTPRMHWRRGHMRQQAFGPGRNERRPQWIEPMLIAAE